MKNYNLKMNLQLFADPSASLQNTTGTMTNEMKTFYEKRLIDQAEPRLVHDQFADYYPVPQNGGKTIEFRKYDSLPKADTPLTEGVTPNGQTLNVTTITSDLHQYGGWTPLTDVLQMTAIDNNVVQATRVLASQAGRTMDSIMAGFERQLDALYHAAAMDVDSDIRVMETMLRRDGGSVEEDFGLGGTAVATQEEDL